MSDGLSEGGQSDVLVKMLIHTGVLIALRWEAELYIPKINAHKK